MNNNLKIVFWGTPEFAAIILDKMISAGYKPMAIVTAPDKPIGRKQTILPSLVKNLAVKNNITVFQPERIKNNDTFYQQLKGLKADLFIVAAYGLIIPDKILHLPKYSALNIHPSLLPKYRGSSPIQAAILNGDKETGTTLMLMDELMDHGPIIANDKLSLAGDETCETLTAKLAELSSKLLIITIPSWIDNRIIPTPQYHDQSTYTKIIDKKDGRIDWHAPAIEIERAVRAYWPWPTAYSVIKSTDKNIDQKKIKILKANILSEKSDYPCGTIIKIDKKIAVATGRGLLEIIDVQLEGKKVMTINDLYNGHPQIVGSLFL
ncbi:MAG: methionyl-tRNA formyltransferase [Patescibacteria group bacterium]|nr:methionyl-tRNA formyltransferase [Patescibacteria group bacterium]MDD5121531.1 methionyl-tRNA formyltransferase [Patescibacteria group bacterium]MDD5222107.1 methionyl-tRNA formyltransferase [Patescibacteria group bacterium]MDD5396305.1 methionyl-tRNA formyltransferase [Patescibacteria group bacterium]